MVTSNQPLTPDPWPGTQPTDIERLNGVKPSTLPLAPINPLTTVVNTSRVKVSWVKNAAGSRPLGYNVYSTPASAIVPASANATEVLVNFAFVLGTAYTFHIVAQNAAGDSTPADAGAKTPNS